MGARPRIVLVAWAFPPGDDAHAASALAIATTIAPLAVLTVVTRSALTQRLGNVQQPSARAAQPATLDDVELVRVPFFPAGQWPQINDWSLAQADQSRKFDVPVDESPEALAAVYRPWIGRVQSALIDLETQRHIDVLLATGPLAEEIAAAMTGSELPVQVLNENAPAAVSALMQRVAGVPL